jgi:hypothetical protein
VAFFLYKQARLLFDMNYHVFAFLLAFAITGWGKRYLNPE